MRPIAVGDRFERLTVTETGLTIYASRKRAARVRCDCGSERLVGVADLLSGHSRSCSCLQRASVGGTNRTHGLSRTSGYARWRNMMARCYDERHHRWPRYGGRGIEVASEWHDPVTFVTWLAENLGPCPVGSSLDRIDNDGPYQPGNVRWSTAREQRQNQG